MLRARLVQHIHWLVSATCYLPVIWLRSAGPLCGVPHPVRLSNSLPGDFAGDPLDERICITGVVSPERNTAPAWAGTALQVLIALSTVLLQVPAHERLQRHGFSPQVHHKLILSNWLRTVAISAHALLSFWIVARVVGPA